MKLLNTNALVIKYINYGEADRILTLFSPKIGKLQVLSKGCRKPRSTLLSASQLFCYGNYQLFKCNNIYNLSQCNVLDTFYNLRNDLKKLGYSSYIIALCDNIIQQDQSNRKLFDLLIYILKQICYLNCQLEQLVIIFELKFLDILGYRPYIYDCVICNDKINQLFCKFSTQFNGILCSKCEKQDINSLKLSLSSLKIMDYIFKNNVNRLNVLKMSAKNIFEIRLIMDAYIKHILEKDINIHKYLI